MIRGMLRGLAQHKLRLALSALAVILGTMFMAGAFVGGDTLSQGFTDLYRTTVSNVDVEVTPAGTGPVTTGPQVQTAVVDQATADRLRDDVPGVRYATPSVFVDGARVVARNGKVVATTGAPRYGAGWTNEPGSIIRLRQGRPPAAPDEIALNASAASLSGYHVGDLVPVLTLAPRQVFRLVGIFGYVGGRDSLGGETIVAFEMSTAQRLMLGAPGRYTGVDLQREPGISAETLRDRVRAALGDGFEVRTGAELVKASTDAVSGVMTAMRNGMSAFGLIALFTGAFLIVNTFSMLVAQRTRELALYRAFGAHRGQVIRAVLLEALLLGLFSSAVGLLLGLGVGAGLKALIQAVARTSLPVAGIVVRPYVLVVTLGTGALITVLAALAPAVRASRVPPMAALRTEGAPDRPLGRLLVGGTVVAGAGATLLGLRLGGAAHGNPWLMLGGGALLAFLGVAMLAPALARPLVATLGLVWRRSAAGRLGVRNTGRNPRRTATTAAALMVGVALTVGASVFAGSAKTGIQRSITSDTTAQLIVSTDPYAGQLAGFDPDLAGTIRAIPGVATALVLRGDQVTLAGRTQQVISGDVPAAVDVLKLTPASGQLRTLRTGEIILDGDTARRIGARVGDVIAMSTAQSGRYDERVVGVYAHNPVSSLPVVSAADAVTFRSPYAQQAFIRVSDDARAPAVRAALDALFRDNPEVSTADRYELIRRTSQSVDLLLAILNVLLALTILIAVLGVVNTLVLSIFERTREIGLLRAVGLSRSQTRTMVGVESVLISVFGVLLGIVVGLALGTAIVEALGGEMLVLTVPWLYLAVIVVLGMLAGMVAAILPGIRAARLNVLEAIAYE